MQSVRVLSRIYSDERIAGVLNRAKLLTARGNYWTRALIASLRGHYEISCHNAQSQATEGWLNLSQAARLVGVATRTLRHGIERGHIAAEHPIVNGGPWVVNAACCRRASMAEYAPGAEFDLASEESDNCWSSAGRLRALRTTLLPIVRG